MEGGSSWLVDASACKWVLGATWLVELAFWMVSNNRFRFQPMWANPGATSMETSPRLISNLGYKAQFIISLFRGSVMVIRVSYNCFSPEYKQFFQAPTSQRIWELKNKRARQFCYLPNSNRHNIAV